jgi:hypothetical protein
MMKRYHAKGMFGRMHHPSCKVRITLREILDDKRAEGFVGEIAGRKMSELDKLVHAMKRTKIRKWGMNDTGSVVYTNPPWSKAGWKYVSKDKWLDPDAIKIKRD